MYFPSGARDWYDIPARMTARLNGRKPSKVTRRSDGRALGTSSALRTWPCPGPRRGTTGRAFCRSSVSNRPAGDPPDPVVGQLDPAFDIAPDHALGGGVGTGRSGGERRARSPRGGIEAVIGQHAVDHIPSLKLGRARTARPSSRIPWPAQSPLARRAAGCRPSPASARSTFSTSPNDADSAARIRSQASASSNAQVRQRAWAANTVGHGSRSTRRASREQRVEHSGGRIRALLSGEQGHVDAAARRSRPSARNRTARGSDPPRAARSRPAARRSIAAVDTG